MAQVLMKDLNKKYDEVHAVKDVNLNIRDKEFQQVGEPLELFSHPANRFVAGFIGSPAQTSALRPYKDQPLTLGIRPEDLQPVTGSDPAQYSFDAVVDVVEPLGSEILLDLKAGPSVMVARVEPTLRMKVHDPVRLALNPERLHFFDTKMQLSI